MERLLGLAAPFDDGPLSIAIVFVRARREEWIEQDANGEKSWVMERLREELVHLVLRNDTTAAERIRASRTTRQEKISVLLETLRNPLISRPLPMLRRAALAGPPDLRHEALRALAVVAIKPVAGDLGAAAAALTADDPRLRVEGARTFLLLVTRTIQ